jgi:hypothetical protein
VTEIRTWLRDLRLYAGPLDATCSGGTESGVNAFHKVRLSGCCTVYPRGQAGTPTSSQKRADAALAAVQAPDTCRGRGGVVRTVYGLQVRPIAWTMKRPADIGRPVNGTRIRKRQASNLSARFQRTPDFSPSIHARGGSNGVTVFREIQ